MSGGAAGEVLELATDILRRECTPEVVAAAEAGEGWSERLWKVLDESGLATIGRDGSFEEAMAVVRAGARFAAPVPLAETVLAHLVDPDAGDGPLSLLERGRAGFGRFARRVLGAEGAVLALGLDYAGQPWDGFAGPGVDPLLPEGALVRAVQLAGALETVLELTVTYSEERHQFGRPLIDFQAVQHQVALVAEETAAAVAAAESAGRRRDLHSIAAAKVRCGEAAGSAAALAHQVHGAIGFTDEHRLQQYTRRLWAWRDGFGTESEWALRLAAETGALESLPRLP